jgi:monofunctional glycosyltransferase
MNDDQETPAVSSVEPQKTSRWLKKTVWLILLALLLTLIWTIWDSFRDVSALKSENPKETAMMRYRENQAAGHKRTAFRRQVWTPLSQISASLIQAVLISEDDKFFQHEGFDWDGIKVAMEKNLDRKKWSAGGSTITQQLAKNLYLNPSKNPLRKIREAVLAMQMEKALTKKRILEIYLNVIEWGPGIYGIGAAARFYFNKTPAELTAGEAIRLASVLPNPLRYSPIQDSNKRMRKQRLLLAERMRKRGVIDEPTWLSMQNEFSPAMTP